MASNVTNVTAANYKQEVLEATLPVLLDVWAAWCGPCRMIAPVLEQLAGEQVGKLKVAKLNSDENMALAAELNIMSLPTLVVFKNGKEVTRLVGMMPKQAILSRIQPYL
ncbi:MAG: thioredoxin [Firmicutes bacterium]|nr:thioredoxin [Dethiobacter sp.]MBS3889248.1 thioredoxin [Bacillota bacterium]MBS4054601.1 thioredoxin [Thermaerobacter sp.]